MPGIFRPAATSASQGFCGGLCDETGATPCAWTMRRFEAPRHRACVPPSARPWQPWTPGMARNRSFRLGGEHFPTARALGGVDIDREEIPLPSLTDIVDNTLAPVRATPLGDITLARPSRTCCLRHAQSASPHDFWMRPIERSHSKSYLSNSIPATRRTPPLSPLWRPRSSARSSRHWGR